MEKPYVFLAAEPRQAVLSAVGTMNQPVDKPEPSSTSIPENEAEPDPGFTLMFRSELDRIWSPRNRRAAMVGLAILLLVQLLFTAVLEPFVWGNSPGIALRIPSITQRMLAPFISPLPLLWSDSTSQVPRLLLVLQLSSWAVHTALLFFAPAFAALSRPSGGRSGRIDDPIRASLSPRQAVAATAFAAMLPFIVLALGIGLMNAGLLFGLQLSGRQDVLATSPAGIAGGTVPPGSGMYTHQCLIVAGSLARWLSLIALLAAAGAAIRSYPWALFWGYSIAHIFAPTLRTGLTTATRMFASLPSGYHSLFVALGMSVIELVIAAALFRRAIRDLEHPEGLAPWITIRRPVVWGLSLSDETTKHEQ